MSINRQVLASKVRQPTEEIARVFDPDQILGKRADCLSRRLAISYVGLRGFRDLEKDTISAGLNTVDFQKGGR
jgi:hypothetical protein